MSAHREHANACRIRPRHLVGVGLAILCLSCLRTSAQAADPYPLMVEIDTESYLSRSGGPISLLVDVQCGLPDPGVAGSLTMRLINDSGVMVGSYILDGLFFSPGTQKYEFLLQPPTASLWQDQYDVIVIFEPASGGAHRLNDMVLRIPGAAKRTCLISVAVSDKDRSSSRTTEFLSAFELESALPGFDGDTRGSREVVTLRRQVHYQDLPNNPVEHCVSDLLVLPDGTFSKLSKQQRLAIIGWVRAGGSVVISLDPSQRLAADAMESVNELCSFSADAPGIYQTTDGMLYFANGSTETPLLRPCGFGKTAIFVLGSDDQLDVKYSEVDLRQAFIHLWKIRREQQAEILSTGKWSWDPGRRNIVKYNWNFNDVNEPGVEQFLRRFREIPTAGGTSLLQHTQPTGMQMFPLWLISLTLFIYVLGIGPVDYYLLGTFQARKWTWIAFPAFTVLFTWGAIATSNWMMQGSNDGGSITFHDITDDGLIARRNVIQTMLLSSARQVSLKAEGELMTPVDINKLGAPSLYGMSYEENAATSLPVYIGSFPSGARIIQAVHKWSPQAFRRMSIPTSATKESSGFDWTIPVHPSDTNSHLNLARRIRSAFGEDVHAQLIRKRPDQNTVNRTQIDLEVVNLVGSPGIFDPVNNSGQQDYYYQGYNGPINTEATANFLRTTTTREEHGIYSVVSQLSPKCDDFLEDLPLLDSSDSKQWLLQIIVNDDNHWNVYRKIYRDP